MKITQRITQEPLTDRCLFSCFFGVVFNPFHDVDNLAHHEALSIASPDLAQLALCLFLGVQALRAFCVKFVDCWNVAIWCFVEAAAFFEGLGNVLHVESNRRRLRKGTLSGCLCGPCCHFASSIVQGALDKVGNDF